MKYLCVVFLILFVAIGCDAVQQVNAKNAHTMMVVEFQTFQTGWHIMVIQDINTFDKYLFVRCPTGAGLVKMEQ